MPHSMNTDQSPETWSLSSIVWSFVRGMIQACVAVALAFAIITGVLWSAGSSWLTLLTPPTCSMDPGYDADFERLIPSYPRDLGLINRRSFHSLSTTVSARQRLSNGVASDLVGSV